MTARSFTLRIEQGSDYQVTVPVLGDGDQPLDVTGWTVRGQIRCTLDSAVEHDLASGLEVTGSNVTLSIPAEISSAWAWRQGVYDVELVDPDGNPTRLLTGHVLVSPEVTR